MRILLLLLLFPALVFCQESQSNSIDQIIQKNNLPVFKQFTLKEPFLQVSNYRNGKRWRYFVGDTFRFKTKGNQYFSEEISEITDSTFSIYRYSTTAERMETFTFFISDIKNTYKYKRGGVIKTGLLSMSPMLPMALLDWGVYHNNPIKNKDFLVITPIIGVGNILLFKHKNFFNKQKIKKNKALKIIIPQ